MLAHPCPRRINPTMEKLVRPLHKKGGSGRARICVRRRGPVLASGKERHEAHSSRD